MHDSLTLPSEVVFGHATAVLAVGLLTLLFNLEGGRPRLTRPGLGRTIAALVLTGVASLLSALALVPYGVGFFGVIHLWTADLLVVAPALALAIGVQAYRSRPADRSRGALAAIAGALVAVSVCVFWGRYVEPTRLVLETPGVVSGRLARPLRIGVLADLQTARVTGYEEGAVDRLLAAEPDIIVVPGDLFQASHQRFVDELPRLRALLARLRAPLGVYAVIGNTDIPGEFPRALSGTGIVWLHNQTREIESEWGTIVLTGLGYYDRPELLATYVAAGARSGPGRLTLTVAHDAGVVWDRGVGHESDLVIAGHTHGGQVSLPFVGALLTLSRLPTRYASGLHPLGRGYLYVSRGVGVERAQAPRIRFLCPPEVTVITVSPRP